MDKILNKLKQIVDKILLFICKTSDILFIVCMIIIIVYINYLSINR